MKLKFILACLVLQSAFLASSHAAVVVAWDMNNSPTSEFVPPESWDQDDNVTSSALLTHGTVYKFSSTPGFYRGFTSTIDTANYIGFTVQATPGYQMNLTDLFYVVSSDDGSLGSHQWGYRIDTGSGFGAWTLSPVLTNATALKTWDFADFSTTGAVEFGFFSTSTSPADVTVKPAAGVPGRNDLQLNGSVTAVPEPSSALLLSLGALAAFRRRR